MDFEQSSTSELSSESESTDESMESYSTLSSASESSESDEYSDSIGESSDSSSSASSDQSSSDEVSDEDSEDEVDCDLELLKILALVKLRRKTTKKKPRQCQTSPLFKLRHRGEGDYKRKFPHILKDDEVFFSYFRMHKETFYYILNAISPMLTKCDLFREVVSPEEKLVITLRFLANQMSYRALSFEFLMSHTTIRQSVYDTCSAIWDNFRKQHFPKLTRQYMQQLAQENERLWQFPHVIGSIDCKHIRIVQPSNSGSLYFNYKLYNSIVLQGIADAHSRFIHISVGALGRQSDGGVFAHSSIGKAILSGQMTFPRVKFPFCNFATSLYFVGDDAYPLEDYLLKPYPQRNLSEVQRIFNYRLSRCRRSIECAFGRLSTRFRYLFAPLAISPKNATLVAKASCLLHNIIIDKEDETLPRTMPRYRQLRESTQPLLPPRQVRDNIATFFGSHAGRISGQEKRLH